MNPDWVMLVVIVVGALIVWLASPPKSRGDRP